MSPTTTPPIRITRRHVVTFADTNVAGNVYFAHYFAWQGRCRDELLASVYPEFQQDLARGLSLVTEFAHMDFHQEAQLFDVIVIGLTVTSFSRTRIEFGFEFRRESDHALLASGRQAVVQVNERHQPCLMPEKLHALCAAGFQTEPPAGAAVRTRPEDG